MSRKEMKIHIDLLKHRGNFFRNINSLVSLNNGDDYSDIIKRYFTSSNPINRESFFHNNYNDVLSYTPTGKTSDLFKMLLWTSSIVSFFRNEIMDFVSKKKRFDYLVLTGDYEKALKELDYIENNISFSMWSLKSRIMLANLEGKRIEECISALQLNEVAKAHANLYAHLTKVECDTGEYFKNIEHIANTLDKEFTNCFLYLYGGDGFEIKELSKVLARCNNYSIIDGYLCAKWIIHKYLSEEEFEKPLLQKSIHVLSCIKNDDEVMLFLSFNSCDNKMSVNCKKLSDNFINKQYEEIFANRKEYLTEIADCSLIKLIIITMSGILSNKIDNDFARNSVLDSIIFALYNVLKFDNLSDFRLALSRIASYNRALRWFDLSTPLFSFWKDCLNCIKEDLAEKCFSVDDRILYKKIIDLDFPPIFFESLHHYAKLDLEYDDIKEDFANNDNDIFSIALLSTQYYMALNKKDYSFAADVCAKSIAKFMPLVFRFKCDDLCNYVINNIAIKQFVTISDVILSFTFTGLQQYKVVAYKNFLDQNDILKPLDIITLPIENQLKIYFLKEICTIDTMASLYFAFSNSFEVENHRIEICKFLFESDPLNKGLYNKEISEILKEQEVRKLNRAIDKSKLSVDYQYISDKTYEKFLDLTKMYHETKPGALEYVAFGSPIAVSVDLQSWCFIAYSRDVILENMYKVYASEFCFGSRGLDTYLSTRVRHGTFENTIRKVFLENNLYNTDNNFFKSMFAKNHVLKSVTDVIKAFREQLICKIHVLTNTTFKVYIENEIKGALFDYCMYSDDLKRIYTLLCSKNSFSVLEFMSIISETIVTKTNEYLECIRDDVLENLKSEIIELLDKLNNEVESYCLETSALSNIRNNISRSKTSIQNKIDDIKNWFYLSESIPMDNYTIDKLIDVLNKNLRQQFDDFNLIKLSFNNSISKEFVGESFVYIYDVLHILLSNAIIHSSFDNLSELKIVLEITEIDDEFVYFCIKNNLSQNCNCEQVESSIKKINEIYMNKEYAKVDTHKEGGMGQIKVLDILYNILNVGNFFEAQYDSGNYVVKFNITKKGVIAYD